MVGCCQTDSGLWPAPADYSAVAFGNGALYAADDDVDLLRKRDPLSGESVPGHTPIEQQGSLWHILVQGDYAYLLGTFQLSSITPPITGLDPAFNCDREFLGGGPLAFARDSVYVKGSNAITRFRRSDGGMADPDWRFENPPTQVNLSVHGDRLLAFGSFSEMGSEQRTSLAALPLVEFFFADGFE